MLSTKEITKMYKGTKITSRVDLYKTIKSGSKSNQQECKGVVLRNFATLPNFHCVFLLLSIFAPNLIWLDHASLNSARVHRV